MVFTPTKLPGAFQISLRKIEDDRGFFARSWCGEELAQHGLAPAMAQMNVGFSPRRGTLRGMHYQLPPHAEAKLVRCTRGALFDVIVDLRRDSPTRGQWIGAELTADNHLMLYAPEGCAHGYLTLADETEAYYLTSSPYAPAAARGVRYDDPAFRIAWPEPVAVISEADAHWPDFHLE